MDFSNIQAFLFNCILHEYLNQCGKKLLSKCLRNKVQHERVNNIIILHVHVALCFPNILRATFFRTDSFNRRNNFHSFFVLYMKNH